MARKKNSGFRKRYASMTEIGRKVGLSARELGTILKDLGIRKKDGTPTEQTLSDGIAVSTPLANGRPHFMWSRMDVVRLLKENGHTPDREKVAALQIQETIRDMCRVVESEDFEVGGGLRFKVAEDHIFSDLLPKLPLPNNLQDIRREIHRARATKNTKAYLLGVTTHHAAESSRLNDSTAAYIMEKSQTWADHFHLELLILNPRVNLFLKQRALRSLKQMEPPQLARERFVVSLQKLETRVREETQTQAGEKSPADATKSLKSE